MSLRTFAGDECAHLRPQGFRGLGKFRQVEMKGGGGHAIRP